MPVEPITINVRQSTGTYIAKAKGCKLSASCTAGPAQAAEALAHKLGLASDLLQEVRGRDLGYGCSRFEHPGCKSADAPPRGQA
ncbi:hypothetical protein D3C77_379030 [compost metagenome]